MIALHHRCAHIYLLVYARFLGVLSRDHCSATFARKDSASKPFFVEEEGNILNTDALGLRIEDENHDNERSIKNGVNDECVPTNIFYVWISRHLFGRILGYLRKAMGVIFTTTKTNIQLKPLPIACIFVLVLVVEISDG